MKLKLGRKAKGQARTKGSGGLKMVLLTHGEKILMAVIVPSILWLIYSALSQESLDANRQPDNLRQLAQTATQNIDGLSYGDLPAEKKPTVRDFTQVTVQRPVDPARYPIVVPLNPPEFPRRTKRSDPTLLSIEDPEVVAGFGLFAVIDPNAAGRGPMAEPVRIDKREVDPRRPPAADGGPGRRRRDRDAPARPGETVGRRRGPRGEEQADEEMRRVVGPFPGGAGAGPLAGMPPQGVHVGANAKVEGRFYAVVLAKVPLLKQLREYERVFRTAEFFRPQQDFPRYLGYIVERAEITREGEADWKFLTSISVLKGFAEITGTWSTEAPEIVDEPYVDQLFTFPLPPLVGRPWDDSVTHSSVPLRSLRPGMLAPEGQQNLEGTGEGDKEEGGPFEFGPDAGFGGLENRGPGMGPPGDPRGAGGFPPPRGPMPRDRDMMMPREEKFGTDSSGFQAAQEETPFSLFRFFDFSVEPGKRYRYRVRLALSDPNHNVPIMYLDDQVIARREKLSRKAQVFRLSDWSDPTPTVVVPFPGRLLAGEVSAPRADSHYDEPKSTVLAKMFNKDQGVDAAAEIKKMGLGGVGNFAESVQVPDHGGPEASASRTISDFEFRTDTTLVDIRGGESLSQRDRELTAPGELLLLDGAGRLVVRSELSDAEEVSQHRALAAATSPERRTGAESRDEETEEVRARRPRGGDR